MTRFEPEDLVNSSDTGRKCLRTTKHIVCMRGLTLERLLDIKMKKLLLYTYFFCIYKCIDRRLIKYSTAKQIVLHTGL